METKKRIKEPTMDFDYVRAINEYMDDSFLNKTLQSLRGGSIPDKKDIVTYKINNTNYLANLYPDPVMRGGKKTMLLDSIFKIPENFSLDNNNNLDNTLENSLSELDIGGARPKTKKKAPAKDKKPVKAKKKPNKKKGGADIYDVDYSDIEDLGGNKPEETNILQEELDESGGARKKKPGRKPKK